MIQRNLRYDPLKDIEPVAQHGFIDIVECFMNGTIPAISENDDGDYNGVDTPSHVGANVTDVFEAMRASQAIEHAASAAGVTTDGGDINE